MATVSIGNNISKEIADIRDACLDSFDREFIVDLQNTTQSPAMPQGAMEYFVSRRDNRMYDYYKTLPAEVLLRKIQKKQIEMESGMKKVGDGFEPVDPVLTEKQVALMLLAIEDLHMVRELIREPLDDRAL